MSGLRSNDLPADEVSGAVDPVGAVDSYELVCNKKTRSFLKLCSPRVAESL